MTDELSAFGADNESAFLSAIENNVKFTVGDEEFYARQIKFSKTTMSVYVNPTTEEEDCVKINTYVLSRRDGDKFIVKLDRDYVIHGADVVESDDVTVSMAAEKVSKLLYSFVDEGGKPFVYVGAGSDHAQDERVLVDYHEKFPETRMNALGQTALQLNAEMHNGELSKESLDRLFSMPTIAQRIVAMIVDGLDEVNAGIKENASVKENPDLRAALIKSVAGRYKAQAQMADARLWLKRVKLLVSKDFDGLGEYFIYKGGC